MAKIFNTDLLDNFERSSNPVDALLDLEIQRAEERLNTDKKGVGAQFITLLVENGNRRQLDEESIVQTMKQKKGLGRKEVQTLIESLLAADIIRRNGRGNYEISSNMLALKASQKVEAENRVLRNIESTIRDRFSRDELLDKQYLDYISPSLELLDLNQGEKAFIERSRKAIYRQKRRRTYMVILMVTLLSLLAAFSFFLYWEAQAQADMAMANEAKAYEQEAEARKQREAALAAKEKADDLAKSADQLKLEAIAARDTARQQQRIAESLRLEAESAADSILKLKDEALRTADTLSILRDDAKREAREADRLRELAQEEEEKAKVARQKAERLNRIISSWNVADRSLQIEDSRLRGLIAREVYNINVADKENGNAMHPNVFSALYSAVTSLVRDNFGQERFRKEKGHMGAIRDILYHPEEDVFFTTGSDGHTIKWTLRDWNTLDKPDLERTRIDTSNRINNSLDFNYGKNMLLIAGENQLLRTIPISGGASTEYIYSPGIDEYFKSSFSIGNDLIAFGKEQVAIFTNPNQQPVVLSKSPSKAVTFIDAGSLTVGLSFYGYYDNYAYQLEVDVVSGVGTRKDKLEFIGRSKEVSFGEISAANLLQYGEKGLLVLGFQSGGLLLIEVNINPDSTPLLSLPTENQVQFFQLHQAPISDLEFDRSGQKLAVASLDRSVSIWELKNRKYADPAYLPIVLEDHENWVMAVAFSNDSEHLITGDKDGNLSFWNLDPSSYAGAICELLKNSYEADKEEQMRVDIRQQKTPTEFSYGRMTREEYQRYFGNAFLFNGIDVCREIEN